MNSEVFRKHRLAGKSAGKLFLNYCVEWCHERNNIFPHFQVILYKRSLTIVL